MVTKRLTLEPEISGSKQGRQNCVLVLKISSLQWCGRARERAQNCSLKCSVEKVYVSYSHSMLLNATLVS